MAVYRLTAKNRDQLRHPTLGNLVWAGFFVPCSQTPNENRQELVRHPRAISRVVAVPALPRPRRTVALSDVAIRPSVRLSVPPGLGAQLHHSCAAGQQSCADCGSVCART